MDLLTRGFGGRLGDRLLSRRRLVMSLRINRHRPVADEATVTTRLADRRYCIANSALHEDDGRLKARTRLVAPAIPELPLTP